MAEGWRVAWFGPNLPASDIVSGHKSLTPDAVAISLVHQTRDADLYQQVSGEGHALCDSLGAGD